MQLLKIATRAAFGATVAMTAGGLLAGVAEATTTPTITTVVGNGTTGCAGDGGLAINAQLKNPSGMAEGAGSLYVSNTGCEKVQKIVKPATPGADTITTIAGNGIAGYSGDGAAATSAELNGPTGLAVDTHGDVFIADTLNNVIREVNGATGLISTLAGTGKCSSKLGNGGPASAASLCAPSGVSVDPSGDLFVSDTGHNTVREITASAGVISASSTITAFAGTGTPGNGGDTKSALKAQLDAPTGVAADSVGDVFIADTLNCEVRGVNAKGIIDKVAGSSSSDCKYGGDGGRAFMAFLNHPSGVGVDSLGNLYISDTGNARIRTVNIGSGWGGGNPATISTYAGTGTAGFSGDAGPATSAEINLPSGITADGTNVFFSDTGNQRGRGIFPGPSPVLPDSSLSILLPLTAVGLLGGAGGFVWLRRRRQSSPATV